LEDRLMKSESLQSKERSPPQSVINNRYQF
jgi:hypothetical protein